MTEYMDTYNEHWKRIVENPDGSLNKDQVARELADAVTLSGHLTEIYLGVTNEAIGNSFTKPEEVMKILEQRLLDAADDQIDDLISTLEEDDRGPFASTAEVVTLIRELTGRYKEAQR